MKKIFFILLIASSYFRGHAQSPILNMDNFTSPRLSNAYYKDLDNNFGQFIGTWVYTNGTTSFKIVIQKKEMTRSGRGYFEDMLIGGYQYIKNGVEKVNTFSNLNTDFSNPWQYNIVGNTMQPGKFANPLCNDCAITEKRVVRLYFTDPINNLDAELYLRYMGNNQLNIYIRQTMIINTPGNVATTYIMTVPTGAYTMTRQ